MAQNSKNKKENKKKKETPRKAKYGTFVCIRWLLSRMWQWDKSLFLSSVLLLPVVVILYALGLYTPSIILDRLQISEDFQTIVWVIIILVGAGLFFQLIRDFLGGASVECGEPQCQPLLLGNRKSGRKEGFLPCL